MTARRRGPVRALAAPIVVAVMALAPLTAALGPGGATAAALPQAADPNPVQVTLDSIRPLAPQPGDTETVTGQLRNTSDQTLTELSTQLRMGGQIGSRIEFDTYAADPQGPLPQDIVAASAIGPITPLGDPTLRPGETEPFQVTFPIDTDSYQDGLPTTDWEVRPLGVVVYDSTTSYAGAPAGDLKTFLSWAPKTAAAEKPTGVAWVWPLVDRPHHNVTNGWADDTLAPEIQPSGRLGKLLTAAGAAEAQRPLGRSRIHNVRVTWAIDPMLVSDVASMAAGYHVTTGSTTVVGTGTQAARTWLGELKAAVTTQGATVLPLPYGDPDIMAAVRAGAKAGLEAIIGAASTKGQTLLEGLLPGLTMLPDDGWPPGGYADQAGLNAMTSLRDTTILLDGAALPPSVAPRYTPTAHTTFTTDGGPVDVVLTDPTLSDDVQDGSNNPAQQGLDLQRYLAETLMIQAENPTQARDVVIAPDRRWNPDASYANALLDDTGRVPWIRSVGLQQVQNDPADTSVPHRQLIYPPSIHHRELSKPYLRSVGAFRSAAAAVTEILPASNAVAPTDTYGRFEQEALSSGWRNNQRLAEQRLTAATRTVTALMGKVRITSLTNSYVTLTSHNGKVPVTISNNLATSVSVFVQVLRNPRLTLSDSGKVAANIGPNTQTTVFINVGAKTSGVFPLVVQLVTPGGSHYGGPVQLYVRSTAYGTVTLIITGAATAALLVAVAIRLGRRALAARRAVPAASS